jgi:hypothetical protein
MKDGTEKKTNKFQKRLFKSSIIKIAYLEIVKKSTTTIKIAKNAREAWCSLKL